MLKLCKYCAANISFSFESRFHHCTGKRVARQIQSAVRATVTLSPFMDDPTQFEDSIAVTLQRTFGKRA